MLRCTRLERKRWKEQNLCAESGPKNGVWFVIYRRLPPIEHKNPRREHDRTTNANANATVEVPKVAVPQTATGGRLQNLLRPRC